MGECGGAPLITPPERHVIIRQWHGGLLSFSSKWRQRPAMSHSSSLLQIFHVRFFRTVSKRFSCEYAHACPQLKGATFKVQHPVFIKTVCMLLFCVFIQYYAGMISYTVSGAQSKTTLVIPNLNLADLKVPLFCAEGSGRNKKGFNVKDDIQTMQTAMFGK